MRDKTWSAVLVLSSREAASMCWLSSKVVKLARRAWRLSLRVSNHRIDGSVEVREVANTGSGVSIMWQRHVDQQARVTVVEVGKIDYEAVVVDRGHDLH